MVPIARAGNKVTVAGRKVKGGRERHQATARETRRGRKAKVARKRAASVADRGDDPAFVASSS